MIEFKNVYKSFGEHRVLNNLNLIIPHGKITFIIGKSGEGKSVTIKHIMALMQPDQGQVICDGVDLATLNEEQTRKYRQKFGMLFQHAALFDALTTKENILFPLEEQSQLSTKVKEEKVNNILDVIEISDIADKYPYELSTGEKKKVGLARALVTDPEYILYDEPTTGMDPLVCEMIDSLIVSISNQRKDLTSIVISHDLKAALNTADNIIFLYKGELALNGTADDFKSSKDAVIRQFFAGKVDGPMEFF